MKLANVMVLAAGVLTGGLFAAKIVSADTLISKFPNIDGWSPIGNGGSYVYADCFVAPGGADNIVSSLGSWLSPKGKPISTVRFEIWGDNSGPDCGAVIAATAPFSTNQEGLNLHTRPVISGGGPLTPGQRYWFVITAVNLGDPKNSPYAVGGHIQNSVYQDNCTFWYSNAPEGCEFDGVKATPEIAFNVQLTPGATSVESTSWGMIKSTYAQ